MLIPLPISTHLPSPPPPTSTRPPPTSPPPPTCPHLSSSLPESCMTHGVAACGALHFVISQRLSFDFGRHELHFGPLRVVPFHSIRAVAARGRHGIEIDLEDKHSAQTLHLRTLSVGGVGRDEWLARFHMAREVGLAAIGGTASDAKTSPPKRRLELTTPEREFYHDKIQRARVDMVRRMRYPFPCEKYCQTPWPWMF